MRIAVLSDIHLNLEALDAVLSRASSEGAGATIVLGDIVGYGADPQAVVELLFELPDATLIAGNHDLAATARFDSSWFNSAAEAAIRWTERALDAQALGALGKLEPRGDARGAVLVHGSVADPAAEYVFSAEQADESFEAEDFSLCFFGHTHMPTMFEREDEGTRGRVLAEGEPVEIRDGRYMLNPGSVGQPRDSDPRASFMLYDDVARTAVVHRVAYDIARAQQKIRDAGLPPVLAERLTAGR
ncbi:MAG: metallophosphoesterase [Actinomycetota bacterium]